MGILFSVPKSSDNADRLLKISPSQFHGRLLNIFLGLAYTFYQFQFSQYGWLLGTRRKKNLGCRRSSIQPSHNDIASIHQFSCSRNSMSPGATSDTAFA